MSCRPSPTTPTSWRSGTGRRTARSSPTRSPTARPAASGGSVRRARITGGRPRRTPGRTARVRAAPSAPAGGRASPTPSPRAPPALVAEWCKAKNRPRTPETTPAGTHHKAWWKCQRGHTWEAEVCSRVQRGLGCPYCTHRLATFSASLAVLGAELAAEWHPTKNGALLPHQVLSKSNKRVWWKCPHGDDHEWAATVAERTDSPSGRSACPFCGNRRRSKTNILALRCPEPHQGVAPDQERQAHAGRGDLHVDAARLLALRVRPRVEHEDPPAHPDPHALPLLHRAARHAGALARDAGARGGQALAPDQERRSHAGRRHARLDAPRVVEVPRGRRSRVADDRGQPDQHGP